MLSTYYVENKIYQQHSTIDIITYGCYTRLHRYICIYRDVPVYKERGSNLIYTYTNILYILQTLAKNTSIFPFYLMYCRIYFQSI